MSETWKRIRGYPGYQASSLGRVRSVPRTLRDGRTAGGVVLEPWEDKDGYLRVQLGRRKVGVHVAVQLAFAGPPEVCHLDGNRKNNKPGNLVYGSKVINEGHKQRNGEKRNGRNEEKGEDRERNEIRKDEGSRPWEVGTSPVTGVTDAR